ncbi:MAG: hypothetical protein ACI4BB_04945, partial [Coprococcus sp.]
KSPKTANPSVIRKAYPRTKIPITAKAKVVIETYLRIKIPKQQNQRNSPTMKYQNAYHKRRVHEQIKETTAGRKD